MTLTDQTLAQSTFIVDGNSARLDIRLPWYRSMPFGDISLGALRVDGGTIDPGAVRWLVGDDELDNAALAATSACWYLQDAVTLGLPLGAPPTGSMVMVELDLVIHIEYLAERVPPRLTISVAGEVPVRLLVAQGHGNLPCNEDDTSKETG
jgi:hypothetical protein